MHKPLAKAIFATLIGCGGVAVATLSAAPAMPAAGSRKALVPRAAAAALPRGQVLEDYGRFSLVRLDAAAAASAPDARIDPQADVLQFTAQPFDTQTGRLEAPAPFSLQGAAPTGLRVVQFIGPVKSAWLAALRAAGAVPVQYVASNGYLVWVEDDAARARLALLAATSDWMQYDAPFYGFWKIDPRLQTRIASGAAAGDEVDVVVQIYAHARSGATRRFVADKSIVPTSQLGPLGSAAAASAWTPLLKFENTVRRVRVGDIAAIAERPDVMFVGERVPHTQMDEKQALILTGDFAPGLASPSYLDFLVEHGFSQTPEDYPIVDVSDSTIDEGGTGATVLNTTDRFLHVEGDASKPVRVAYFNNCSSTPDDEVGAYDGHGSLNAGIIADYDQSGGYPFQDAQGQHLGLGINPFGRVGSTAIFVGPGPTLNVDDCGGSEAGIILSNWRTGAKISSNSWGSTTPPATYDETDQAYDAGVRDADPGTDGNQSMIYVFAASNSGPGPATVSSPGAGKNVITVGASENLRPFTPPATSICGPDSATNPENVASFSGRGPAPGRRAKPEVIAPGAHIEGVASVYSGFTGSGVCVKYYPLDPAQTIFTYSSGTSQATPSVSGVASLAYWWIEHGGAAAAAGTLDEIGGARAPSPAMMKAWLIAHPSYLSGVDANDDLPSNNQGYGAPNMSDMFSATPKVLLDQSEVFENTGETRNYVWEVADASKPVRIAIAYTDAPGALGTSPQVNDLDLTVTAGGQTYHGNHFQGAWSATGGSADTQNNYEAVFLPAGTSGALDLTVTAANIAGDGVPNVGSATDQDFALICNNCLQVPSFTIAAAVPSLEVCAGAEADVPLHVGQIAGFTDPVTLSASGNPSGTEVSFAPNPVLPPGDSTLTATTTAATAPGIYPLSIVGTTASITKTLTIDLDAYDAIPTAPSNELPADGAENLPSTPSFSWAPSTQGHRYRVQISRDAGFSEIVVDHETMDTAWTLDSATPLEPGRRYWWRVIARNACGDSAPLGASDVIFADGFDASGDATAAHAFTTMPLPGSCPADTNPITVFSDALENGAGAWTHAAASGSVDTWRLGPAAHSGSHAWQVDAPAAGGQPNDQWLISPSIAVPANLQTLSLLFWNRQSLKSASGACNDGALVEASTDGGQTWAGLAGTALLTDPYDGTINASAGNPLAGESAWCGDPQPYLDSVIDVPSLIGQNARFRFRIGHDRFAHRANPNWAIDDVRIVGCR